MTIAETYQQRSLTQALVDPIGDPRWDSFVDAHPEAGPFHHSTWAKVLVDSYGFEPRYHVIECDRKIVAGWPAMLVKSRITGNRLVGLPFSDYCSPLIQSDEQGRLLYAALLSDGARFSAARIEARGWLPDHAVPDGLVPSRGYVRHIIDLKPGFDAVRKQLSENARRSLKRASQSGVVTRIGDSSESDLETFLALNLKLRRKHSMLPQPRAFFEAIWRHIIAMDRGYVLFAERNGRALASILCLSHGATTVDKFAVNDEAQSQFRGSHAVMWASIEHELKRNALAYDMGRSGVNALGLHRFKEQWGGRRHDATYYFNPAPGGTGVEDPTGVKKMLLSTFARIAPEPIFKAAGTLVYRHLG